MFLINRFFFLLNNLSAQEFATQESSKLIIPGIIFSVGAIMLIACVIYSNYTRRKKLQEAERLKRERIKKFSEEANIKYSDMPQAENGVYKSKRIITDSPESSGFNPAAVAEQAQVQNTHSTTQAVPTFTQTMPNTQVMPSMSALPATPQVQPTPQAQQVTPTQQVTPAQPAAPATPQVMPSAPGVVSSFANSTAPQNNTVQTPVMPTTAAAPKPQGMSMGSQVLPGMDGTQTTLPEQGEKYDNIADLVRRRVQEVENQKRNEAAGIKKEETSKDSAPQDKAPHKEEAPKRKFEYVPEYKPGEGPKKEEPKKEEIKQEEVKQEETKQEDKEENHLFEKSVYDEDNKTDEEPKAKTVEQLRLERSEDIAKKRMDDETQSMINQAESGKAQKILVERSEAFVEEDEKAVSKKLQEEAEPVKVERKPVIPKVTSKKTEMDRGLVREVQAKLDSTREYEKAIELKEAEKEKLKEEYLQKRLHLETIKKRLKEEGVIDDDKQVKLSKEQISRNLLDNVEKGVTYQQGMKVSLMDMPDPDAERVIMPEDYEDTKTEEIVEEQKLQPVENETKEETLTPAEEVKPILQEEKTVFEEPVKEEIPEKNITLEPVQEKQEETLHEEITKVNDNVSKQNGGVLNSLESMFGALDDDTPEKAPLPVQKPNENQRVYNPNEKFELEQRRTEKKVDPREQKEEIKNLVQKAKDIPNKETTSAASILNARLLSQATSNKAREEQVKKDQENILDKHRMKQARDLQNQKMNTLPKDVQNENVEEVQEEKPKRVKLDLEKHIEENKPKQKSILEGINLEKEILYEKSVKTFTGLESAPDHKKIIAVISPGNCGKTTIAVNLAYELANRGISTCLIDTDNEKKDVYYYINKQIVGSMSRLVECEEPEDMYKLGIPVKDNLMAFTDNKGISYDINYSKLYKLIAYAHEKNEAVIIDVKSNLKSETLKDILNLSTNICIVVDTKPSTLSQIAEKFARVKSAFINKDVTVVANMDEGKTASKSFIRNIFKRLEYRDGGMRKQYYIKTSDIFSVEYDTKAIIQGLITQEPAVTVKDNSIITDISKIASHYYNV